MKLSSCRDLKLETLSRVQQMSSSAPQPRGYRMRRARALAREEKKVVQAEPAPVAAVGVAPWKGGEYRLAVRVFRGHTQQAQPMIAELERYGEEVEVVTGVHYRARQLTIVAGGSCGHFRITAGTLGGFVEDAQDFYMMSNNHVFANSNFAFQGDPIIQPGPADIPGPGQFDIIGSLDRWFPLSRVDPNGFDVGLATFGGAASFFNPHRYVGIGTIDPTPAPDRFAVTRVAKRGRTTGTTRGTVSAFELDGVAIDYAQPGDSAAVVMFDNQIEVIGAPPKNPFSQPGDSGSFIIDRDTLQPYALLYGGGKDNQGIDRTLAHFFPDVLDAMGVTLVQ